MKNNSWRRAATTAAAAVSALVVLAPSAGAAATGPDRYSGAAEALSLDLTVRAPLGLLDAIPGVEDGVLHQRVSLTGAALDSEGAVDASATLLDGLLEQVLGGGPADCDGAMHQIAGRNIGGLVDVGIGRASCLADAAGRVSRSSSELVSLKVTLAPLFDATGKLPPAVEDALEDTLDTAIETVDGLVGDLNGVLGDLEDTINSVEDLVDVDIPTVIPAELPEVPDVTKVDLVSLRKLWSDSTVRTEGDAIVSIARAGIVDASLLGGLVRVPTVQFETMARATGKQGGAMADAKVTVIAVQLADDTIIEVSDHSLTVGDFTLDLEDPALAGLPVGDLLDLVKDLLGDLLSVAGLSINQGEGVTEAAADGKFARAEATAFQIAVRPLHAASALGAPVNADDLSVEVALMPLAAQVRADNNPPRTPENPEPPVVNPPAPIPAPAPAPNLPRTGGSAVAALIGALSLGGAFGLRKRG